MFYLVDCIWGEWVTGECSKTCGRGIRSDYREKLQIQLYGGIDCQGDGIRHEDCFIKECPSTKIFENRHKIWLTLIKK